MPRMTEQQKERVKELASGGLSARAIEREVGFSKTAIVNYLKSLKSEVATNLPTKVAKLPTPRVETAPDTRLNARLEIIEERVKLLENEERPTFDSLILSKSDLRLRFMARLAKLPPDHPILKKFTRTWGGNLDQRKGGGWGGAMDQIFDILSDIP